jgi:hypothetical protein
MEMKTRLNNCYIGTLGDQYQRWLRGLYIGVSDVVGFTHDRLYVAPPIHSAELPLFTRTYQIEHRCDACANLTMEPRVRRLGEDTILLKWRNQDVDANQVFDLQNSPVEQILPINRIQFRSIQAALEFESVAPMPPLTDFCNTCQEETRGVGFKKNIVPPIILHLNMGDIKSPDYIDEYLTYEGVQYFLSSIIYWDGGHFVRQFKNLYDGGYWYYADAMKSFTQNSVRFEKAIYDRVQNPINIRSSEYAGKKAIGLYYVRKDSQPNVRLLIFYLYFYII